MITEEARVRWDVDGYLLQPGLLSGETCARVTAALSAIIAEIGEAHARQERESEFWAQMRRSDARTEVFWHPDAHAFDESEVMRVGHVLHHDARLAELASFAPSMWLGALLGSSAVLVQSALIYKQPQSELVQFGVHRDAAYLPVDPPGALGLAFVALDDCDAENGALRVVPGSHRLGPGLRLQLGPNGFERSSGSDPRFGDTDGVLLEMQRGDVVFVRGDVYHASGPNRSTRPRRGLILHAMASHGRLHEDAWLNEPPGGFIGIPSLRIDRPVP